MDYTYETLNRMILRLSSVSTTEYTSFDILGRVTAHKQTTDGEEITGLGGRSPSDHYATDDIRQGFTGYEKDDETGLDFAKNRNYNANHGRFTSTDPLLSSGRIGNAQTWHRYSYVLNNPLKFNDPLGLYECDASVSAKNCERFEKARQELEKARDYFQKNGDTKKADALTNALNAIGTLNDKNGLTIAIGKISKGAAAEVSFGLAPDGKPLLSKDADGTGNYVANVVMTFKSSSDMTAEVLAHEGSHVEDRQKFISAMFAAGEKDPEFNDDKAKALPENLTKYATESKAYHNSSYLQEYSNKEGGYWKRGWTEVDRQAAINTLLKTNKLYKVTPEAPGMRIYETEKKP